LAVLLAAGLLIALGPRGCGDGGAPKLPPELRVAPAAPAPPSGGRWAVGGGRAKDDAPPRPRPHVPRRRHHSHGPKRAKRPR